MTTSDLPAHLVTDLVAPAIQRCRDVLYWFDGDHAYVLACDSNAGIGQRQHDALNQPARETGYSAAKVALMEVLATGATPFVLTDALGGPRDAYGRELLAGIQSAIDQVDADVTLTGSDETNIPTQQTAIGVTVLGRVHRTELRLGRARTGDVIVAVGVPKDGLLAPYREGDHDIADLRDLQRVVGLAHVHEVVPVGSRGIAYESQQLASGVPGNVRFRDDLTIDVNASAGSSTCFLVALPPDHATRLRPIVRPPITVIGNIDHPTT